jgi:hypothetical protein
MKVGMDILYKTVLSKFEFHENRRSDIYALLKDVNKFPSTISVFIDVDKIRCRRPSFSFVKYL